MPTKKNIEAELREIINELDSKEDQVIRDLIETAVSQKHNSGTSIKSRRDFMEKKMYQYLIDNPRETDAET